MSNFLLRKKKYAMKKFWNSHYYCLRGNEN